MGEIDDYDAVMARLRGCLRFTDHDLTHNQRSTLSKPQLQRFLSQQTGYFMLLCVFTVAGFIGLIWLTTPQANVLVVVFTLACFGISLYLLFMSWQLRRDLMRGNIAVQQGRLIVRRQEVPRTKNSTQKEIVYSISIGRFWQEIPEEYYTVLVRYNGLDMRVYYLPGAKHLLSMDYLGGQTLKDDWIDEEIITRKPKLKPTDSF